jgi:DNA-binding transcriptional ArsR family regulator
VSNEAVTWAMDHAPMLRTDKGKPDTTARHVLQVLAEHARPDGTNSHPSLTRIQYRTGYDRSTVQRALRRLETGKLIEKDGTTEGRNRYKLSLHIRRPETDWEELEREEDAFRAAAAERKRRSRQKSVTHATPVTVTGAESVTVTHAEAVTGDVTHATPSRHALNAWPSRTERGPNHQQPSDNQLHKDSSAPAVQDETGQPDLFDALATKTAALHQQRQGEELAAFGAFWAVYPKKKNKAEALDAWKKAVKDGVDPDHITAGATAYARERHGEDPKYTKFPATWLNKGCYDDEPDEPRQPHLRAVSGDWAPSTADQRAAQGQALAAMFREQEARALEAAHRSPKELT